MSETLEKFGKASANNKKSEATTVKTARQPGESVLSCFDLSSFSTTHPVFFVTYKKIPDPDNAKEVKIINETSWQAKVNPDNNTLTNLTLAPGYTDIGNEVGDCVECIPTAFWANSLIDGLNNSLDNNGKIKPEAIPNVTTAIKEKSITADKIDFTTIPMFSATTSKWEVLPQNQHTIVKYDSVIYDTAKMYDTKTFTAKVPKDGVYHIDARTGIAQTGFFSGYTEYITIFKNGTMIKESNRTRGTDNDRHLPRPSLSVDLLLKKNDEINIRAFCSDQRNYGGDSTISEFSMRLVGII